MLGGLLVSRREELNGFLMVLPTSHDAQPGRTYGVARSDPRMHAEGHVRVGDIGCLVGEDVNVLCRSSELLCLRHAATADAVVRVAGAPRH